MNKTLIRANDFKITHKNFNCCFDNSSPTCTTKIFNEIKNRETKETNKDNPKYFS